MWLACLRGVLPQVQLEEGGLGNLRVACGPYIWGAWSLGRGAQTGAVLEHSSTACPRCLWRRAKAGGRQGSPSPALLQPEATV